MFHGMYYSDQALNFALPLFYHCIVSKNVQHPKKEEKKKLKRFLTAELSPLELQLWGCGVLLSHMGWLPTCQRVKHSYCMPSAAV